MNTDVNQKQAELQQEATELLRSTPLLHLLEKLGKVTQTGSSVTGLMVYPDIDFAVQTDQPHFDTAVQLTQTFFSELKATSLKLTNFGDDAKSYYVGIDLPYNGHSWHIDATISLPGPIVTNPPELADWIANMSDEDRHAILELKQQLISTMRYVGARSQPPHTFRSSHLYEAVIKGGARSVAELEAYFAPNR